MASAIEDYALIGDCETAALISRKGSVDWLCLPRFDSDACFAALLGSSENGCWQLAPRGRARVERRYRDGTLILETQFHTHTGSATLIDFMPLRRNDPTMIRLVRGERGKVAMHMDLAIRFDYGRVVPWVTRRDDGALLAMAGPHLLSLRSSAPMHGESLRTVSDFTVRAGKTVSFELRYGSSYEPAPARLDWRASLRRTEASWTRWVSRCKYRGPHADALSRSLITLRAMTYAPTGGVLAAVTTSLPEQPRGARNWDYRYCWVRDATFTLLAMIHAGYQNEARRWQSWLSRSVAGSPEQVQVLYGVAGERHLLEWEVPWLKGYKGALPVRVGNAASTQLQLDLFGEIADVLYQTRQSDKKKRQMEFDLELALLERLGKIWREPDHGIWEVRGRARNFTHSKVMTWVAFDRAIKSAEQFGMKAPIEKWRVIRDEIHRNVCRFGFNAKLNSFVQYYGSKETDASLLLLALVGFLPPTDLRIAGTVRRIESTLMRDGFVLRYETEKADDGLPAGEGAFLACSFWLADNYELLGRHKDAVRLLHKLLKLQNDVGLLSEEYHPEKKCMLGNFPQALSHVALASTIINLNTARGPALQRASSNHRKR